MTVGFNLASATVQAAHDNPNTWFVGVDQSPICVTADGLPDATFACKGDAKTLLPKYISLQFQEDQAGYLAGIVAAGASKSGEIGAIGGSSICAPCVRYIQGYELGAKSVTSTIKVDTAYVTADFSPAAFQDQAGGKTYAENFLAKFPKIDVLFQVAGLTGNGFDHVLTHELGHTLGLDHNMAASSYGRASVMDYPAPYVKITNGKLDLSDAYAKGLGIYDLFAIRYATREARRAGKQPARHEQRGRCARDLEKPL